jgi:hypothetical protein
LRVSASRNHQSTCSCLTPPQMHQEMLHVLSRSRKSGYITLFLSWLLFHHLHTNPNLALSKKSAKHDFSKSESTRKHGALLCLFPQIAADHYHVRGSWSLKRKACKYMIARPQDGYIYPFHLLASSFINSSLSQNIKSWDAKIR